MAVEFFRSARRPAVVAPTDNPNPTGTIGSSGATIVGGFLQEGERNAALSGRSKYDTWMNMIKNVSIVSAGARFYRNLLIKATWQLDPADKSDEAKRLADDIQGQIDDLDRPWASIIGAAGMYRFFGFSTQEWVAKRREEDGAFVLADIAQRPQSTIWQWDTQEDGKVIGCIQRDPNTMREAYLPRAKLLYIVDDTFADTPEGLGIYRQLANPADTLLELQRLETYGYEMDLQGVPLIRAPLAAIQQNLSDGKITEAQANAATGDLITFLKDHARNPQAGLMLDSAVYTGLGEQQTPTANRQWDIELLQGGSADSAVAVSTAIERLNREMARIMGVEELMLGSDSAGSFAMSKQKSDNFALMVDSALNEIRFAVQRDVVGAIFRINGWDRKLMPKFRTEQIAFRDIEMIGKTLKDMSLAGAMLAPDDPAINEIRRMMGLSEATSMDALLSLMATGQEPNNDPPIDGGSDTDGNV